MKETTDGPPAPFKGISWTKDPQPQAVTTLFEIEALCAEAMQVDVLMKGQVFRFTGRRLVPNESKEIKLLTEQALPALVEGSEENPRYNFDDPGYQRRKEDCKCRARAMAIWMAFPSFKATAEQLVAEKQLAALPADVESVTKFIQERKIEETALDLLFAALTREVVEKQAYVGFTSGNSFPKS